MPPAIHTGQKLMPLAPIKAPIATSAPQAGISSEMKASDSPNASARTIGALIGASGISFWPVWIAGGIGAALGDWVSYWFGFKYKEHVAQMWPLSRYPEILPRGEAFVKKWGAPSIFIGRFFGPLRASVPLAAGIFEMPYWQFQFANFVSALVWSAALLLSGDVIAQIAEWLWRTV
jgi:membrane protein DedA with SNARE-associated domain